MEVFQKVNIDFGAKQNLALGDDRSGSTQCTNNGKQTENPLKSEVTILSLKDLSEYKSSYDLVQHWQCHAKAM